MKSSKIFSAKPLVVKVGVVLFMVGTLLWVFTPLQGSIWKFSPDEVARGEAEMWRYYYEKRHGRLAIELYRAIRRQYGLSPWDASCMAIDLAKAARVFQVSRNRQEAEEAIPLLEKAYERLARTTREEFGTRRAAILELEWWQQRREHVPPEEYAGTIAELARVVYSCKDDPRIEEAAQERARAMAFRDAHRRSTMTEADWQVVREKLTESYRLFHLALGERALPAN